VPLNAPGVPRPSCYLGCVVLVAAPTPFPGVAPWLASFWQRIQNDNDIEPTPTEVQADRLVEYAAQRFGSQLLKAADIDDLDDRLDELVSAPGIAHLNGLMADDALPSEPLDRSSVKALAEAMGDVLGAASGQAVADAQPLLDAWLDAQRQLGTLLAQAKAQREIPPASKPLSLYDPDVPVEFLRAAFHNLRGGLCGLAILYAIMEGQPVEPWLAEALTKRLIESAFEHLRLLASIPEITVSETAMPRHERLDLARVVERHQREREAVRREFDEHARA
jgi:hypothetical protein